jgi:hypothetical protein
MAQNIFQSWASTYTVINLQGLFLAQLSNCQFFKEDSALQNQFRGDTPRKLKLLLQSSSLWQGAGDEGVFVPKDRNRPEHSIYQFITFGLLTFIASNVLVNSDYVRSDQATKQFDSAVSTLVFVSNQISMSAILTEVLRGFPQYLQTNSGQCLEIRHSHLLPNSYIVSLHAYVPVSLTLYKLCS